MTEIIAVLNNGISWAISVMLMPFSGMQPAAGLAVVSAVSGLLLLILFKYTSNQKAIAVARDKLEGGIIEIRLFADDPAASAKAAGRALLSNLVYLRYMLPPFAIAFFPMVLLLVHLNQYYGFRPSVPGEKVLIAVRLSEKAVAPEAYKLEVSDGVEVYGRPLISAVSHEIFWRVRASGPGLYSMNVAEGGKSYEKTFVAGASVARAGNGRVSGGFIKAFTNPGEPLLPKSSGIESVEIVYPERGFYVFGVRMHWMLFFFVVSLAAGMVLKPVFRVRF